MGKTMKTEQEIRNKLKDTMLKCGLFKQNPLDNKIEILMYEHYIAALNWVLEEE